jgi:hypothetical protein
MPLSKGRVVASTKTFSLIYDTEVNQHTREHGYQDNKTFILILFVIPITCILIAYI